jgi:hypothetical protein
MSGRRTTDWVTRNDVLDIMQRIFLVGDRGLEQIEDEDVTRPRSVSKNLWRIDTVEGRPKLVS